MAKKIENLPKFDTADTVETNGTNDTAPIGELVTEPVFHEIPAWDPDTFFGKTMAADVLPPVVAKADRKHWDWDTLEIGQGIYVKPDEAASARSSAISFGKGTRGRGKIEARAPRTFITQSVEMEPIPGNKVKAVLIRRTA